MMSGVFPVYLAFLVYFIIVLLIGWRASRRTHNQSDYFLGGRRLGSWVSAMSAGASDMSGWLLLGLPGFAYLAGLEAGWLALGLFAGTLLNWKYLAPALRRQSEAAGNAITLPDFFAHRFPAEARPIRLVAAIFILLFYLFYTSSGLVAAGKLFESVLGLDYRVSMCVGTLVILIYTCLGGFLAVSWTDLFQGLLMFFALITTAIIAIHTSGGSLQTIDRIGQSQAGLLEPFMSAAGDPLTCISIASLLAWGLGYFGQPHILARFMAIQSTALIPRARHIAVFWSGSCLLAAIVIGLAGHLLLPMPLKGADSERVFLEILPLLYHPLIAGICLAAILAAIMSTADSQLLVASSALTEDIYRAVIRKPANDATRLRLGRGAVIVISLLAFLLALNPDNRILDLVAYAWSGFGASFGPALIATLFWKRTRGIAVIAGILTGGMTVILWKHIGAGYIAGVNEIIPGFILSGLVILLLGLLDTSQTARNRPV